jgi:hypothetical protein
MQLRMVNEMERPIQFLIIPATYAKGSSVTDAVGLLSPS